MWRRIFSPDLDPLKPPPPLVPEKIEDGGTHVPALGSVENAVIKLEETEQKEEEEEEEEEKEGDNEKSTLAHQKKRKKKKEAPMMEVKQEEEDEGKETETEKKKKKCVSLVSFLLRWNRRHFFEVGKMRLDPRAAWMPTSWKRVRLPSKMRRKMWKKRKKNCLKPPKRRQQETTIPSTSSQISTWKQTKATTEETSATTGSLVNRSGAVYAARDRYTTFIRKLYHAYKNALNSIYIYNALSLTFYSVIIAFRLVLLPFPAARLSPRSSIARFCFFFSFSIGEKLRVRHLLRRYNSFFFPSADAATSRAALSC